MEATPSYLREKGDNGRAGGGAPTSSWLKSCPSSARVPSQGLSWRSNRSSRPRRPPRCSRRSWNHRMPATAIRRGPPPARMTTACSCAQSVRKRRGSGQSARPPSNCLCWQPCWGGGGGGLSAALRLTYTRQIDEAQCIEWKAVVSTLHIDVGICYTASTVTLASWQL